MRRLFAALLLASFGCDSKPVPSLPPAEEKPPDLPSIPPLRLAYLPRIDAERFPVLDRPPKEALRWGFGADRKYRYRAEQRTLSLSTVEDRSGTVRRTVEVRGDGIVEVRGLGKGRGRASYMVAPREAFVEGRRESSAELNRRPAAKAEYALEENGTVTLQRVLAGGGMPILEFLFALPPSLPEVGSPMTRRYRMTGEYRIRGTLATTLEGFHRVERDRCARLVTEVDLEVGSLPGGAEGRGKIKGRMVAYFSLDEGSFLRVEGALAFVYHSRAKTGDPMAGVRWSVATLETQTHLRLRRR